MPGGGGGNAAKAFVAVYDEPLLRCLSRQWGGGVDPNFYPPIPFLVRVSRKQYKCVGQRCLFCTSILVIKYHLTIQD